MGRIGPLIYISRKLYMFKNNTKSRISETAPAHGGTAKMESGGIFRTIIITALFIVLVCDYTTLITQLYQSMNIGNNVSSPMKIFAEEEDGESFEMKTPSSFREDKAELDLEAELDLKDLNLFGEFVIDLSFFF